MNSKELILKKMFGENVEYLAGYERICNKLIETGVCITTIQVSNKFKGGIWNFIKEKPYPDGVDLIQFTLNKEEVYESELFKKYKDNMLKEKKEEIDKLVNEIKNLQEFINDI